MKKVYTVKVVETLVRVIEVPARNEDEAYNIIRDKYDDSEIVLDADDYLETNIVVEL